MAQQNPVIQKYNHFQERDDHFTNICFADSETTGLDPWEDEMIQFCLITNERSFIWYIHPTHNRYDTTLRKFVDAKTIDYNHHKRIMDLGYGKQYEPDVLSGDTIIKYNVPPRQFATELAALINDRVVVMHNGIRFDAQFINRLFNEEYISCDWACLDSMVLAKEMGVKTFNHRYNQQTLGMHYRIPNDDAHDAFGDTKQLIRIFKALVAEQQDRKIAIKWYEKK